MNCDRARERLSDLVDGQLNQFERAQAEAHLRRCPACAEELRLLRQTLALLADLEEVDVPADFRPRLRQRLAQLPPPVPASRTAARTRRPVPLWQRWGIPAAAAAAVAALVYVGVESSLPMPDLTETARPPVSAAPADPGPSGSTEAPSAGEDTPVVDPGTSVAPVDIQEPTGTDQPVGTVADPGTGQNPPAGDGRPDAGPDQPDPGPPPAEPEPQPPVEDPTGATGPSVSASPNGGTSGSDIAWVNQEQLGMAHLTYRFTMAVPDLAQAEAGIAAMAAEIPEFRQVGREPQPDGAVQVTLEVFRGTERAVVEQLKERLAGRLTQTSLPTEELLATRHASLQQRISVYEQQVADLQARLQDPALTQVEREAAAIELANYENTLRNLRTELGTVQYKSLHTTIVLVLEAQR